MGDRIESIKDFYTSSTVASNNIISENPKKLQPELLGQWATERMLQAAKTLNLTKFIIPYEKGGIDIPTQESIECYLNEGYRVNGDNSNQQMEAISRKMKHTSCLWVKVEISDKIYNDIKENAEEDHENEEERVKYEKRIDKKLKEAYMEYEELYEKWSTANDELVKTTNAYELKVDMHRNKMISVYEKNNDAISRVKVAMDSLKKFVAELILKVPTIEEVVRDMGAEDKDPYLHGDLRLVYSRLNERYKQCDHMGITTTIISGMQEVQGNSTLEEYMRKVEEIHQTIKSLDVSTVSVSDLCAMIAIGGMNPTHREEFLKLETILALTCDIVDDGYDSTDDITLKSSKRVVPLFQKVKKFVTRQSQILRTQSKFNISVNKVGNNNNDSTKYALQKLKEAQNTYPIISTNNKGKCYSFLKTGVCDKGSNCPYSHVVSDNVPGETICRTWASTGTCSYGKRCTWVHSHKEENIIQQKKVDDIKSKSVHSTVLFQLSPDEDSDESINVILVKDSVQLNSLNVVEINDHAFSYDDRVIGWDTMASIHVAKNRTIIPNSKECTLNQVAKGVGGTRDITHTGRSPYFDNLEMSYIKDGCTPNIMSVGKILKKDSSGKDGIAIFTSKGAVRFRATKEITQVITDLVDGLSRNGLIEGSAVMKNNIYSEDCNITENKDLKHCSEADSVFATVINMYANRIKLSDVNTLISFMVQSGLSKRAIEDGINNNIIKGIPQILTIPHIQQYFSLIGKDIHQQTAEITKATLRQPIDYEKDVNNSPGTVLVIDGIDPSFSRMKIAITDKGKTTYASKVVPSLGGYKDAVIGYDQATGFSHIEGRTNKKNPHLIVQDLVVRWNARWNCLKVVKADSEFITKESMDVAVRNNFQFKQSPPGDHRMNTGSVEGVIRWIQDGGQSNMNRLKVLVKNNIISAEASRSLWYHALRQSTITYNMRASLSVPNRTRFQEGTGIEVNLSNIVLMPFGTHIVGKKLHNNHDGRGDDCIYIGPSMTVQGGIVIYNVETYRVSIKYAFQRVIDSKQIEYSDCDINQFKSNKEGRRLVSTPMHGYNTRSKTLMVNQIEMENKKPEVPSSRECRESVRWIASAEREAQKIMAEDTLIPLQIDERGIAIIPKGATILRLIHKREYKWKADPETNEMCWLECSRFVADGSMDPRTDLFYAECPDRTILFLMTHNGAVLKEYVTVSDITRAYLNALSVDRNIVIIAHKDMIGLPRISLLNKGLYGTKGGALSWQIWIDDKMVRELHYEKKDVARGIYTKQLDTGEYVRIYRHSDDLRISSTNIEGKNTEEDKIRNSIRLTPFTEMGKFLGCTFESVTLPQEKSEQCGQIILVRQEKFIEEMEERFRHLHERYNNSNKVRKMAIPVNAMKSDDELSDKSSMLIDEKEKASYQSLIGSINWIVCSTRPDSKFGYFLISKRLQHPREWDMYIAVYLMDYLIATKHTPLVLGGSTMDPEVYSDASFASMPERRSVIGHFACGGKGSGAVYASVSSPRCCVTSIFEAELIATSTAIDTAIYITRASEDLAYEINPCRKVKVDNEADINWIRGNVSNKRSKHVDIKLYHARHMQERGEVEVEYVKSEDNIADILTKPLPAPQFRKLAGKILGHDLLRDLNIGGTLN